MRGRQGDGGVQWTSCVAELRRLFGTDLAEQTICGTNKFCVDYYFRDEATIVEVAMSLRNPTSEFERDILKAIMAQDDNRGDIRKRQLRLPRSISGVMTADQRTCNSAIPPARLITTCPN
ncbi:MAG: hypothetical protein M3P06_22000 [Acidobacteriota bacterium]|nr:hypothetical protein [Acidobacteriota bacterium]